MEDPVAQPMETTSEEDSRVSPKNDKCNGEEVRVKEEAKEGEDEEEEYIEVYISQIQLFSNKMMNINNLV